MDFFWVVLQKIAFLSISGLPLGLGTLAAVRHLRAGAWKACLCHLAASIAAGAATLFLLWGSFFGDDLSSSSTASLAFVIAPVYAAVAQGIVYRVAKFVLRNRPMGEEVSGPVRKALLLPLLMLVVLLFGMLKIATANNDLSVAERSTNPQTLHRLLDDSRTGKADSFGVPLMLAQNRNAPPEILAELAKHKDTAVRAQVALNPKTPLDVVVCMRFDGASMVRELASKRLASSQTEQQSPQPEGERQCFP
jgi:hypothetical protein